jgi:hypothetical protein
MGRELRFSVTVLRNRGDGSTRGWGLGIGFLALLAAHEEEDDCADESESDDRADDGACNPGF